MSKYGYGRVIDPRINLRLAKRRRPRMAPRVNQEVCDSCGKDVTGYEYAKEIITLRGLVTICQACSERNPEALCD